MSIGWDRLPLLSLKCVLENLNVKDALAATSTCRHWRSALMIYEGHKDTLKLQMKQFEQNLLLARLFRKNVINLHIYINGKPENIKKFMNFILPQYFDAMKLQEILFIGPSYQQETQQSTQVHLKRVITESLVFKHMNSLQRLALVGCNIDTAKSDDVKYTHKQLKYRAIPLTFDTEVSAADALLSRCNTRLMMFSTLQHIITEYQSVNTDCLETLSHLTMFTQLTLNVTETKEPLFPIDWRRLRPRYPNELNVGINIIAVSQRVMDKMIMVLSDRNLKLVSFKAMFCKILYYPLLVQVVDVHKSRLTELVWVDCPYESTDSSQRFIAFPDTNYNYFNLNHCCVNPFILLCWQCDTLKRLVIHGYWLWKYDLLGMVRLCNSLERLEVSSVIGRRGRFPGTPTTETECAVRVVVGDTYRPLDGDYVKKINERLYKWQLIPWNSLHRGLQAYPTYQQRADYVVYESRQPLITLCDS